MRDWMAQALGRQARGWGAVLLALLLMVAPAVGPAAAAGADCGDRIVNGGFEAPDLAPWTATSAAGFQILTDFWWHSGQQSAWLAGYDGASDFITQTVTLPPALTSATLQFWTDIETYETSGSQPFDSMRIELRTPGGALVATLDTLISQQSTGDWQLFSYDVAAYAGQTVQLVFHALNDEDFDPTDFYVDDVSLLACSSVSCATYDFNGDHVIDVADVTLVAAHWGRSELYDPRYDIAPIGAPDGMIDVADVALEAAHFGEVCP